MRVLVVWKVKKSQTGEAADPNATVQAWHMDHSVHRKAGTEGVHLKSQHGGSGDRSLPVPSWPAGYA